MLSQKSVVSVTVAIITGLGTTDFFGDFIEERGESAVFDRFFLYILETSIEGSIS
jgi:hypothetical protein